MRSNHPILMTFLGVLFAITLGIGLDFYGALAVMLGWNWFMVPATGFPTISYGLSFGLVLFASLIHAMVSTSITKKDDDNPVESVGELFLNIGGQAFGIFLGISLSIGLMALVATIIF